MTALTNEKTILEDHGYVCDGNEMYHHHVYCVPTQVDKQTICTWYKNFTTHTKTHMHTLKKAKAYGSRVKHSYCHPVNHH